RSARDWVSAASAGGWCGTDPGIRASATGWQRSPRFWHSGRRSAPDVVSGDNVRPCIATTPPMLDPTLLRNDLPALAERLRRSRGFTLDVAAIESLEAERKRLQVRTQELQSQRNAMSREIGQLMGQSARLRATEELEELEAGLARVEQLKAE